MTLHLVVWLSVWWLVRLPVAVPDFHVVAHLEDRAGECPHHDHLNRWHASESAPGSDRDQAAASFHWHWIVPGATLPDANGPEGSDPFEVLVSVHPAHDGRDAISALSESAARFAFFDVPVAEEPVRESFAEIVMLCRSLVEGAEGVSESRFCVRTIDPMTGPRSVAFVPLRC